MFILQFPITALREIKILQLLEHDNVVELIEICRTKPTSFNRSVRFLPEAVCASKFLMVGRSWIIEIENKSFSIKLIGSALPRTGLPKVRPATGLTMQVCLDRACPNPEFAGREWFRDEVAEKFLLFRLLST